MICSSVVSRGRGKDQSHLVLAGLSVLGIFSGCRFCGFSGNLNVGLGLCLCNPLADHANSLGSFLSAVLVCGCDCRTKLYGPVYCYIIKENLFEFCDIKYRNVHMQSRA